MNLKKLITSTNISLPLNNLFSFKKLIKVSFLYVYGNTFYASITTVKNYYIFSKKRSFSIYTSPL